MKFNQLINFRLKAAHDLERILLILSILSAASGCQSSNSGKANPAEGKTPTASVVEDWISVFFTDPENPNSKNYRGGPDQLLAEAINRAHVSVDIAVEHSGCAHSCTSTRRPGSDGDRERLY
jgi:hypothetical protein